MPILDRLFRSKPDPRESLRPLWHRVVEVSREPKWYAECGVADTVPGRFDMITAVLALVLLRLEKESDCAAESALLAELFVSDMDGQLRESGVGDIVVGKHIGKLMAALGGRLGAYRKALAEDGVEGLQLAVSRNVTLNEGASPEPLAVGLRTLAEDLRQTPAAEIIGGTIRR